MLAVITLLFLTAEWGCRRAGSMNPAPSRVAPQEQAGPSQPGMSFDPDVLRAQANEDARSGRIRNAIAGFEALVRLRPQDADAWQGLGLLYMREQQYARSLDALSRSATLKPQDPLTQYNLGTLALNLGRLDQADRALRAAIAQQPDNARARAALAIVTMRKDPSPAGLAAAEQQADSALRAGPDYATYKTRGQIYMAERRFQPAIKDFQAALRLNLRAESTYLLLSQCYASAGQPDRAARTASEYQRLFRSSGRPTSNGFGGAAR